MNNLQLSAFLILAVGAGAPIASASPQTNSPTLDEIADRLEAIDRFAATVDYTVSLAMTDEDVVYNLAIADRSTSGSDPLAPVHYIIDWTLNRGETPTHGFSAYFSGHHYNFRGDKLLEYHYTWDSVPFLAGGGVHLNAQFTDLLPQLIGRTLRSIAANPDFTYTIEQTRRNGVDVTLVDATEQMQGVDARRLQYTFSRDTDLPLRLCFEYNPSQISEQTVTATYRYGSAEPISLPTTEEQLIERYPDAFANFRQSNYRIENLRGHSMPSFSLPTVTGERFSYTKGERLNAPTVIALIDPDVATAEATVAQLRRARLLMPRQTDLVLAFMTGNIDTVEALAPGADAGEYLLLSAKSMARDCGVQAFPTVIVVNPDGKVAEIILGFNNSLTENVIQSVAVID